jgi:hypothetical protein
MHRKQTIQRRLAPYGTVRLCAKGKMNGACEIVLFDADGRVRSSSRGAAALLGGARLDSRSTINDALADLPALREWVASATDHARATGVGDACIVDLDGQSKVNLWVTRVSDDAGVALVATPVEPPAVDAAQVSQQSWHDIKNQLGGLKLYVTFLRMKLGNEDDLVRETSEKIVSSIDTIIRSIADIRRGVEVTKGEEA